MFENLTIFSTARALASHAATRQSMIAQNVANADTPGYRTRDLASFADTFGAREIGTLRATRPGHLMADQRVAVLTARSVLRPGAASPNGNNVSLEQEMFAAAEANGDHDRALAVYRSAMTILRTSVSARG